MDYLDAQSNAAPQQAAHWAQLADCWQKKLWHQMSVKLLSLRQDEYFLQDQNLLEMHRRFVSRFADQIKQLVFVHFSIAAANQLEDGKERLAFLETISKIEHVQQDPQARLLCKLEIALMSVDLGDMKGAKTLIAEGKTEQDEFAGIMESDIYSKFFLANMAFCKAIGDSSKYFQNTMLYLTYTHLDSIPEQERITVASDVGLAALLGETYNFGELLRHPILDIVRTNTAWLADMLLAFNAGDIKTYERLFADASTSNPTLAAKRDFLNQKVRIMTLMEIVLSRSSSERTLSFAQVAQALDCKESQVEMLVMKAFSLKLLRGKIDQVNENARFTWVQPRVLDMNQVARLRDRLDAWGREVSVSAANVERQAPELLSLAR